LNTLATFCNVYTGHKHDVRTNQPFIPIKSDHILQPHCLADVRIDLHGSHHKNSDISVFIYRGFQQTMASTNKTPVVKHDEKNHVFYLELEGIPLKESPRTEYAVLDPAKWDFYHTETPEKLREQGYGHTLVKEALKVAKDRGVDTSKSSCSFVRSVMQEDKHSSSV
jgi:predicted GNAT family acetyltransferase